MNEPMEQPRAPQPHAATLREVVGRIAWEIEHDAIPPGDLSALRRGNRDDASGPAFWKVAVRLLEPAGHLPAPDAPWRDETERRWVAIFAGMAEMKGLHRSGLRLGGALADAEVAEARVLRLMRAHGEALHPVVRGVVHQLATSGSHLDWYDLAELILSDGRRRRWEAGVRRRIALDYYRTRRSGRETADSEKA